MSSRANPSSIELLEPRIAPAVLSAVLNKGVLTITSDGSTAISALVVTSIDSDLLLLSASATGTVTFNGTTAETVFVPGVVKSIRYIGTDQVDRVRINVLGGAPNIEVETGDGINLVEVQGEIGALTVNGGAGDDTVLLTGNLIAKKNVTLQLGDGSNSLNTSIVGGNQFLRFMGSLIYRGGSGTDSVNFGSAGIPPFSTMSNFEARRGIDFDFGTGLSSVSLTLTNFRAGNVMINHSGSELLTVGITSSGEMALGNFVVRTDGTDGTIIGINANVARIKSVDIATGEGTSSVGLMSSELFVNGKVRVVAGDGSFSGNFSTGLGAVRGAFTFIGASGDESITLSGSYRKVDVLFGDGGTATLTVGDVLGGSKGPFKADASQASSSTMSIFGSFGGPITILGSSGVDSVQLNEVLASKAVTIKTGDGNDEIAIETTGIIFPRVSRIAGALKIEGGGGDDTLTIGGNTLAQALFTKSKVTIDLGGDAGDVFNDNNLLGEYKKPPVIL